MERDPDHPIIDRPWEYSIAELHYHCGLDGSEPFVDLVLHRDAVVRRLRFWSPRQFEIQEGCFPYPTHGMQILDVSARRLDRLRVWVSDFEDAAGKISFWARDVVDLDAADDS
jgi:hypothetical protein